MLMGLQVQLLDKVIYRLLRERPFGAFFICRIFVRKFNPMKKFLQFVDAADDAVTYPADRLLGMTVATDATLLMKFESSIGSFGTDGAAADIVTLTITANTEKAVMKAISDEIALGDTPTIVVCDDVADLILHPDVLSCTIAIDS